MKQRRTLLTNGRVSQRFFTAFLSELTLCRLCSSDYFVAEICRYMFNDILTAEQRERTHIFNTFFYGQLTKENRDTASGLRFVIVI